jgi:hypothetical protein
MRGPNGEEVATAGAAAFADAPHCAHRQAKRRWRMTWGLTGGISISSYSPINSIAASDAKVPPHSSQTSGLWSRTSSGSSASRRLCGSCPGFAPPGRALSRFAFLSVEGGLDEVREVFSGCCNCRTSSINCSLLSCRKSSLSIPSWIQTFHSRARGWAITILFLQPFVVSAQLRQLDTRINARLSRRVRKIGSAVPEMAAYPAASA